MCGIIGFTKFGNAKKLSSQGLKIMSERGKDATNIIFRKKFNLAFGHNLHSMVDYIEQPLETQYSLFVSNCEIYNWKELNKKYSLKAKNDAELIQRLIDEKGTFNLKEIVDELDGVYAFAYYSKETNKIYLARDLLGVKPLVYYYNKTIKQFAFASEKKALPFESKHLNPRQIISYTLTTNNLKHSNRKINKKLKKPVMRNTEELLLKAVSKRIPEKKFALLLSGGIDSSLIGQILRNNNVKFNSYFAGIKDFTKPKDLEYAKKVACDLNSKLKVNLVSLKEFETTLPKIIKLIESTDPVRVGIASTIYFATKKMSEKVCFSGLGADELFAGYNRFKDSNDVNKDCYSYLIKMYENDLYFEDIITMSNKVELRVPFLDKDLVEHSLLIPPAQKMSKTQNKKILRKIAIGFGLDKKITMRPKKAAQYGSNFDKAINKLAKQNNFKSKAEYLNSLQTNVNKKNIPIAALISTGKDSLYAMQLMQKQGYEIKCLITIDSKNKDSYMFHTPTISLGKLQSKALNIPLVIAKTKGKKEKELKDLEKTVKKVIKEYDIEGLCSGALFSNYQRERIEKICESLGIRSFSPLWHMNQKKYMQRIVNEKMKVMITKIACYGLNESWLGKIITKRELNNLKKLEKKFGINVAGEGGEYETLVLDMKGFSKQLDVKFEKQMENDFIGVINIKKSKLIEK